MESEQGSSQSSGSGLPKPEGRFNDWGQRKWITASDEKQETVERELRMHAMGSRALDLFRAARLTDSDGIEFVFISNTQFGKIMFKESGLVIVPCFVPFNPAKPESEERQAAMMKWGQFIYDGWAPNSEWTGPKLEQIVGFLDDIVSLFSLVGRYYAYWEPKYTFSKGLVPSYLAHRSEFESLANTLHIMDQLPIDDREALSRSLAWISNALRDSPVQRFLLLFVSIEGLATYIERETDTDSPLHLFAGKKLSKKQRGIERDLCIRKTLESGLEPATAVQEAYFNCIVGNKVLLKGHLDRVFEDKGATSTAMFDEKVVGKTMWELRCDLAHGSLNVLSEEETRLLSSRVDVLEDIARRYIRTIFSKLVVSDYFPKTRRPLLVGPSHQMIGSPGTEWVGPTDMAEFYTNVEALSSSQIRRV